MERRNACFTCTTPYQVIGALSICMNEHIEADLYVFGMFDGYQQVCSNIRSCGLFRNVYDIECSEYRFTKKVKALFQILFYKKTISRFLPNGISYDTCYTSSRAHIKTLMFHELMNRNKQMKFVIYEDGLGTYRPGISQIRTTNRRRKLEQLFDWNIFTSDNTQIEAYEPDYVNVYSSVSSSPVKAMPRIDWAGKQGETVRFVFGVISTNAFKERVIFFDDLRNGNTDIDNKLDKCCEIAKQYFDEKIIYKPHPRSAYHAKCDIKITSSTSIPMEAIYSVMENLEELIIISCTSTAAFTPKLLFNSEPIQIDIHKIACSDQHRADLDMVLNVMENMYKDKSRIIVPNTMDEFKMIVKEFAGEMR